MNVSTELLAGKTVFVTGAGANIGRSIALEMASQGADVYFADRDAARCEKLEQEIGELGRKTKGFVVDLSSEEQIAALYDSLEAQGTTIDTLVNNVATRAKIADNRAEWWQQWQHTYETNVFGPCYLTKLVVDAMISNGKPGNVLFITSIHQRTICQNAAYSSSKAALSMIVRELALQLAPHNIRVNGIAPGYTEENADGEPVAHRHTPLGQTSIPPHFIGRAAVYLSAEYFSKHTTGSILTLDSGLSLGNHLTLSTPPAPSRLQKIASKLRPMARR